MVDGVWLSETSHSVWFLSPNISVSLCGRWFKAGSGLFELPYILCVKNEEKIRMSSLEGYGRYLLHHSGIWGRASGNQQDKCSAVSTQYLDTQSSAAFTLCISVA